MYRDELPASQQEHVDQTRLCNKGPRSSALVAVTPTQKKSRKTNSTTQGTAQRGSSQHPFVHWGQTHIENQAISPAKTPPLTHQLQARSQPVFSDKSEGPFCLFCTFIFRNERNWTKKSARGFRRTGKPMLTWLTGSYAPELWCIQI